MSTKNGDKVYVRDEGGIKGKIHRRDVYAKDGSA